MYVFIPELMASIVYLFIPELIAEIMYLVKPELIGYSMYFVRFVPSDADDNGVPTTLSAWPRRIGYHAQGSYIPFGEFLTYHISWHQMF